MNKDILGFLRQCIIEGYSLYAQKAAVSNGFITQVEDIFEKNLSTVLQIDNGKKA